MNMWDQRFSEPGYLFGTEPARFVREHVGMLAKGSRVLCIADGEGRNSVWLAGQGMRVSAFDASPVALEKARSLAAEKGVSVDFALSDAADFDWDAQSFDAVVGVFFQFAGPELRDQLFAGMIRATRPGGLILVHGYTPKQLEYRTGGPSAVENLYTDEILRQAFSGQEIVELRSYEAELAEGTRHVGTSALIDLVARRR